MITEVFVNYDNFIPFTQVKGNFQGIWSRSRNSDLRLRGAEENCFYFGKLTVLNQICLFMYHSCHLRSRCVVVRKERHLEHYYFETLTGRVGRKTQNNTDCGQDILSPFQRTGTSILPSPVNALNSKMQTIIKRSFWPVQRDTHE
jgi:hypothetical protein